MCAQALTHQYIKDNWWQKSLPILCLPLRHPRGWAHTHHAQPKDHSGTLLSPGSGSGHQLQMSVGSSPSMSEPATPWTPTPSCSHLFSLGQGGGVEDESVWWDSSTLRPRSQGLGENLNTLEPLTVTSVLVHVSMPLSRLAPLPITPSKCRPEIQEFFPRCSWLECHHHLCFPLSHIHNRSGVPQGEEPEPSTGGWSVSVWWTVQTRERGHWERRQKAVSRLPATAPALVLEKGPALSQKLSPKGHPRSRPKSVKWVFAMLPGFYGTLWDLGTLHVSKCLYSAIVLKWFHCLGWHLRFFVSWPWRLRMWTHKGWG